MEDDALRPVISIVAQSVSIELILPPEMRHSRPAPFRCPSGWARSRQPRYWVWNAAGLVGNDLAHRRPCRLPLRHLSQGIDPCLGYLVGGLGRQRPGPHAIPTKAVAAVL